MKHTLILLTTTLILNVFLECDTELNVIPRDTEVMVNDSTYMNCSTSLDAEKVQWRHGDYYVYTGRDILEPYNVRFSVEIDAFTRTSNLVIRSVQPSDAGQYECAEDEGFGERRSAQLIVLGGDPVCKSSVRSSGVIAPNTCGIKPDELKFSCSITYHGNIFPILQWTAREVSQSIAEGLVNFTTSRNDVTYTLTMKSTLGLNNSSFICQTTRASKRNYSCSSDVINVLYVLSSKVTIKMTMSDEVNCLANTSQSCSYKWKWFGGYDWTALSDGQTLKPTKVGWHRCEATCSIGNESCTVEPMYVEVYSTLATSKQNLLTLLVLIALPVIALICVAIYFKKKKELERKEGRNEEQELQRLMDKLPEKYKADPVLVKTIRTKASVEERKPICGLAILNKELFAVSEKSSEVEAYDSVKFSFSRRLDLTELIDPWDIVSCNRNKCLYILDYKVENESKEFFRVDTNGKLIKKWSTGDYYGQSLSVTDESNIILTVLNRNQINEYSPDGELIREIDLSLSGFHNLWHAIKLTNGHFLVTHGGGNLHRVCIVDGNRISLPEKSFGGRRGFSNDYMDVPSHLAIDGSGFVMVADMQNGRVLLLNSDLEFRRELLKKGTKDLKYPVRLILDQKNNHLFVVDDDFEKSRILIFQFNQ